MADLDLKRIKILVIDDEWFMRSTIRQILVQIGITSLYEAGDVETAIRETVRVQPSLVLCDSHMPGEDGLAYVAKLRKAPIPAVAAIPVVMLTSDGTEDAVKTAVVLHVEGYLVKPVSIGAVKKAIERALKITIE